MHRLNSLAALACCLTTILVPDQLVARDDGRFAAQGMVRRPCEQKRIVRGAFRGACRSAAPGVQRFIFDLDGLPPGTSADGAMLTFTAVSPNDAIEVNASLN
jgi:hypothetical protein